MEICARRTDLSGDKDHAALEQVLEDLLFLSQPLGLFVKHVHFVLVGHGLVVVGVVHLFKRVAECRQSSFRFLLLFLLTRTRG